MQCLSSIVEFPEMGFGNTACFLLCLVFASWAWVILLVLLWGHMFAIGGSW